MHRLQGHVPRVLVFGSGLENLPFVRTLMWEPASPYRPIGLCPGKEGVYAVHNAVLINCTCLIHTINQTFTGVGSGVCIQHRNTPVNLITLYTATR